MGGTGVAVGGTSVAVGGIGVAVGGTGVGGTNVAVGGTKVAVGGTEVAVGGTGVGGSAVAVGALWLAPADWDAGWEPVEPTGVGPVVIPAAGVRVGSSGACGAAADNFAPPDVAVMTGAGSALANSARGVSRVALATNATTRATTPIATKKMPMR